MTSIELDKYLPRQIREKIEEYYYARINAQAHLDQLAQDQTFLENPDEHVALYADHGVVHVRDVAQQILQVLKVINGVLIPERNASHLVFMQGYGVMVAYLHDIGMADFSPFGRAMHAEFAAQTVFQHEIEPIVETIWAENWGNVAWRLLNLADNGVLKQNPKVVLRELLAMCVCHSKSKVPISTLNDAEFLRQTMQTTIATPLAFLYQQQRVAKERKKLEQAQTLQLATSEIESLVQTLRIAEAELANLSEFDGQAAQIKRNLSRHYGDFSREAFAWLTSDQPDVTSLVDDVTDTLHALRCADALRQRGAVLNTSGGYQVFVSQQSANAIFTLKKGADEQFFCWKQN